MATLAEMLRQTGYAKDGQLEAPAPTQPNLSTMAGDYIRQLPQKFNENQAEQMALLARAFPDDTLKNANTKAMAEMAMQTPFNALTAFHGTPHKILGKFDISKVGTGEGAQAYGHGMYFAENPAVATQYKNILSKPEFTKNAKGMEMRGQLPRMLDESYGELVAKNGIQQTNYGDVTDIVGQRLDRQMKDALKANDMDWYNKTADMKLDLARFKESPPPNTGNIYKVDIPDADIPMMLDWDKPLSQQPKSVQNALAKYDPDMYSVKGADYDSAELGQSIYQRLIQNNVQKFGYGGNSKRASEDLNALGIKGIRYLDEGSRQAGGTSNFVVFEPSNVKILEENAKPVARKELIQQQLDKLE